MSWLSDIMGGKSKSSYSSTTVSDPWAPAVPYLKDNLASLSALFNGGAPQISDYEQQGYDMLKGVATAPSASMNAALAENAKTASGAYLTLDSNPYLKDIAERVGGQAMKAINQTFGGSGRTGSGLHAQNAGEGIGNALTDLYGRNYANERGLQQNAVGMAPSLEGMRYMGPSAMIEAGKNISARPFDIASQYTNLLNNTASLGGTTQQSGMTKNSDASKGIFGKITNRLFGG